MGVSDFGRDLRQAVRALAGAPGFALGVILSLTLGIVANTAAFSFINAAVFRPFPGVTDQHELVRIGVARSEGRGTNISSTWAEYETLAASVPALTGLAAHLRTELAVTIQGESSATRAALVSRNYFDVLGVRPAAGRFFAADDLSTPVAVISHDLWRRRFEARADTIGQLLLVNGASVTIIGVGAPLFHGVQKGGFDIDIWLPPELAHLALRDAKRRPAVLAAAGLQPFSYIGRRRADTTLAAVQGQVDAVAKIIDESRPANRRGTTLVVERVWLNDPAKNAAAVVGFMAVPLLVLLIACVNAGNLLLARASRQMRDWQVRLALGASTWRIVRQVLAECLVLALASASISLLLSTWALQFAASLVPIPMPVDVRVQLFTIAITLTSALAFGLGPALRVARRGMDGALGLRTVHSSSRSRVRAVLIGLQAAVSLGLLATGAQFVNTARAGFGAAKPDGAERLLIAAFDVDPLNLAPAAADAFYARVLQQTAALDGVVAVGVATSSPLGTFGSNASIRFWAPNEDRPDGRRGLGCVVAGRYFDATRAALVAGRYFTSLDETAVPRTAIVNESFARQYLGGRGPGASLRVADSTGATGTPVDVEIVGVVGPEYGLKRDVPLVYLPAPLSDQPARTLYVQFDESGRFSLASLQQVVRTVDYRIPIRRAATLRDQEGDTDAERRLLAGATAALGLFALALATGGLYGVVSYLVALRYREIGIRLALGASRESILRLILWQGLLPAAIGAAIGAGSAVAIGLVVRSRLYGAAPVDPMAFAGATVVLAVAMVTACVLPARHAARIDAAITLRSE